MTDNQMRISNIIRRVLDDKGIFITWEDCNGVAKAIYDDLEDVFEQARMYEDLS